MAVFVRLSLGSSTEVNGGRRDSLVLGPPYTRGALKYSTSEGQAHVAGLLLELHSSKSNLHKASQEDQGKDAGPGVSTE